MPSSILLLWTFVIFLLFYCLVSGYGFLSPAVGDVVRHLDSCGGERNVS